MVKKKKKNPANYASGEMVKESGKTLLKKKSV